MPQSRPETRFIFVTGGVVSALGKGIAAASIGTAAGRPRPVRDDPEVRPLHQRRPGHDEPVPARRGVRDRGRRRDRPRPRPLRALHRRQHQPRLQRDGRRDLQLRDPARAPRRLPRRHRPGDPAHHRRDQEPHPAGRRVDRRRHRHHRDRRHGRRHRVAAVPRGAAPVPRRPGPRPLHVRPPHARALPRPRRRAQDQADPALRPGAAPHRHPAGHGHVPLRGGRSATRSARRSPCSPTCRWRRSSRRATSTRSTRCRSSSEPRASTTACSTTSASTSRPPTCPTGKQLVQRHRRRHHAGADRPGRQVQPARRRLPVGDRGAQPRAAPTTAARSRCTGSTPSASPTARSRRELADLRRHPRPRRLRRARDRGQDQGRPLRPRARRAVPRHLPRDADRGLRVRPPRRRHGRRQLHRVRPRDPVPGDRPPARAEGGARHGRHDAPGRRPGQAARGHARPRDLRRGRHLRAPPPPLRGQQPPAQAPRARRARVQRHVARRPAGRGRSSCRDHPFFVASQYHPEFKSRPLRPQPLFRDFVGAAMERARERAPEVEPSVRAESHAEPR